MRRIWVYLVSAMSSVSFDVNPVTECDDEYWSRLDPSQTFQQPPGKPSKVAFCNAFIRLLKIQAFASRTIVSPVSCKLTSGSLPSPTVHDQQV